MHVLIFEPGVIGHRLHYVRHMVQALTPLEVRVTLAVAESAPASPEFAAHLADLQDQVVLDASLRPSQGGFLNRALHAVRQLRETIERHRPDRVYVPSGDGLSQLLGLRRFAGLRSIPRGVCSESLLLRGAICYPQDSRKAAIKARLSWSAAARAPWDMLHLLDPLVYAHVRRNDPASAARCELMPDPVELPTRDDRIAARRELGITEAGRYLAIVGLINNRKGCDKMIEAFAAATLRPTDRLLLAGRIDPETRPTLLREPVASLVRSGRIVCIDRTLDNAELMTAIEAADMIAAFYPRHVGSASSAIRAAAQGRPILASDYGWLGSVVPRFGLGMTINADQAAQLPAAIEKELERSGEFAHGEPAKRFVAFHRVENFRAHWADALRQSMGLPRSADWLGWESVNVS